MEFQPSRASVMNFALQGPPTVMLSGTVNAECLLHVPQPERDLHLCLTREVDEECRPVKLGIPMSIASGKHWIKGPWI